MNIYAVRFSGQVEADRPIQGKVKSGHVYVLAGSFERALAAARERHPGADISGVSRQNDHNGLSVIVDGDQPGSPG